MAWRSYETCIYCVRVRCSVHSVTASGAQLLLGSNDARAYGRLLCVTVRYLLVTSSGRNSFPCILPATYANTSLFKCVFNDAINIYVCTISVIDEWISIEQWWNDSDKGKFEALRRNLCQCPVIKTNSTLTWLESSPGLRGVLNQEIIFWSFTSWYMWTTFSLYSIVADKQQWYRPRWWASVYCWLRRSSWRGKETRRLPSELQVHVKITA